MSKQGKNHILIPALITAAAAYFGLKKKSENISEIAKDLVNRAIKDQTRTNHKAKQQAKKQAIPLPHIRRRCLRKRNYRDTYYG
jgi:hypothetical protein